MAVSISKLTSQDLGSVDKLMKRFSATLGFLPLVALRDYIERGGCLGAKTEDGRLIGYLLYGKQPHRFRIIHLCVSEEYGGRGIARQLVEALKQDATSQKIITLHCRRDFSAHKMWPKLGFVPTGDKPGRSLAQHPLTLWKFILARDDQLSLFQANILDEITDVIIDAQIFFDLYAPKSDSVKASQALLSDFLIDSLNLWITDELFVEIDREKDEEKRHLSQQRAHEFSKMEYTPAKVEHFESILHPLLPADTPSKQSDIRQLAKAAASDVDIFVTRDQSLLNKVERISELTGLKILSPTELIIQIHELSDQQSYIPDRVSGFALEWRRLTSNDLAGFPFTSFLAQGERKGEFREDLGLFLASPNKYECELLWSEGKPIAIRVIMEDADRILSVLLSRVAQSTDYSLFERYLVIAIIYKAVREGYNAVKFEASSLTEGLKSNLLETGFTEYNSSFVRFCFTSCLDRRQALSEINKLYPRSVRTYQNMDDIDLESKCSPLVLEEASQKYFLVSIRPGYGLSLVDMTRSANDFFGGNVRVLLRWSKVYYRSKTSHKVLKPPARILWYESGKEKKIVAVSRLDEVVIGTPKTLFKKYKALGILDWEAIYSISGGKIEKEIMALVFSHTFPFQEPIPLNRVRAIYAEDNSRTLSVQSPLRIQAATFQKLFQFGYPAKS